MLREKCDESERAKTGRYSLETRTLLAFLELERGHAQTALAALREVLASKDFGVDGDDYFSRALTYLGLANALQATGGSTSEIAGFRQKAGVDFQEIGRGSYSFLVPVWEQRFARR